METDLVVYIDCGYIVRFLLAVAEDFGGRARGTTRNLRFCRIALRSACGRRAGGAKAEEDCVREA